MVSGDHPAIRDLVLNAKQLRLFEAQIAEIDRHIIEKIRADPEFAERFDILQNMPGVAEVTAFILLIEMPDLGTLSGR